jgi:2-isopropylmalate synthase
MKLEIYDTTLRDGAQRTGISFSLSDKLRIAQKLAEIGFDFVEGGWSGSNPKDAKFFKKVKNLNLGKTIVCDFTMTSKDKKNLLSALNSGTKVITVVGKTWDLQVKEVLKISLKENLSLIKDTCKFFFSNKKRVFFDAEHFFDGFKSNPDYAIKCLKSAQEGKAERIILCDTNGGTLSWEVAEIIREVKKKIKVPLGIHAHNDSGLAVANTLVAVKEGVLQVQGTINGYGERCGNADLCQVIPNLQLKMGYYCLPKEKLSLLTELSKYVAEIANISPDPWQPFVGANAFSHKGGIHADAILKWEKSYQHIDPSLVGNFSKIVVSELSGKGNVLAKAKEFGIFLSKKQAKKIAKKIKELENKGFHFEGADASLELLIRKTLFEKKPFFEVLNFKVFLESKCSKIISNANVKLKVKNKIVQTTANGNGPVNALDRAIKKGLLLFYPQLKNVNLTDYKVRILDGKKGTAAKVRVLIESSDKKGNRWYTVGASTNIVEASWQALSDSYEYFLLRSQKI